MEWTLIGVVASNQRQLACMVAGWRGAKWVLCKFQNSVDCPAGDGEIQQIDFCPSNFKGELNRGAERINKWEEVT